ncbi:MAG: biotin/lipoate A/B protein ligase family protein [Bacteroidales bacterium]
MLFVENTSLDPWLNIALEEYLLKNYDQEIVMLWRSKPSVIVGKHQNTLAEINLPFVIKNSIPVVRRLSGGGTVFHDPGNINFTFIRRAPKERLVDFKSHTQPVIDFLQTLGVDARFEGKNDIRVNGLKISGNAEHVFRDKVLHHGTLLFDADLGHLNEAIRAREELFDSKAIRSARSIVANISEFLPQKISRQEFMLQLKTHLKKHFAIEQDYIPGPEDWRHTEELKASKYLKWEWNYAWSPVYTFRNAGNYHGVEWIVELKVAKGIVESAQIVVEHKRLSDQHPLICSITGAEHTPDRIAELLYTHQMGYAPASGYDWDLLALFF